MLRLGWWIWKRKSPEEKRHPHRLVSKVCTHNMAYHCWYPPWFPGFGSARCIKWGRWKDEYSFIFQIFHGGTNLHMRYRSWFSMLVERNTVLLHKDPQFTGQKTSAESANFWLHLFNCIHELRNNHKVDLWTNCFHWETNLGQNSIYDLISRNSYSFWLVDYSRVLF